METMSYPCSPLTIPFPTQFEENGCLLWSPKSVAMIPHENANMYEYDHGDPSPDDDHQLQKDDDQVSFLVDMMVQEANDNFLQDDGFSNVDVPFGSFDDEKMAVAVQEEVFMEEESSVGDLLLAGAMAVEAGDSVHASAVVSRLDDLLADIACDASPLDHLGYYFARGLQSRLSGARTECHPAVPVVPANRLPAYQMLQELTPFVKFAHFTANQAILEATADDPDVHIVDFNIDDGIQWPSLMSDLARHHGSSKPFHLTAITVAGATATTHHTEPTMPTHRWLSEFAASLHLPFRYTSLHVDSEEGLHELTNTTCKEGSPILSCDTTSMAYSTMHRTLQLLLHGSIKVLQPKLVILIEEELFRIGRKPLLVASSFTEFFSEALHHFSTVVESLASCFVGGGSRNYGVCLRVVEEEMVGLRIEDCVGQHGSLTGGASVADGQLRVCEMSSFSIAQGKMLVGLFDRGFGVVHDKGRLSLCWKSRPLTSVSVWTPM